MENIKYVSKAIYLLGKALVCVIAIVITLPLTIIVPGLGIHLGNKIYSIGREVQAHGEQGLDEENNNQPK